MDTRRERQRIFIGGGDRRHQIMYHSHTCCLKPSEIYELADMIAVKQYGKQRWFNVVKPRFAGEGKLDCCIEVVEKFISDKGSDPKDTNYRKVFDYVKEMDQCKLPIAKPVITSTLQPTHFK